jgi:hypothetical protein
VKAYIVHTLRSLLTPTYASVVMVYLAFAWFLASPDLDARVVRSTQRLMETYELVLMSVMMANYLLFVMLHFAGEWRRGYRDMLATRLTCGEMFWSLVVAYGAFFLVGFLIPTYAMALIQQYSYSPGTIRGGVFLTRTLGSLFGYTFCWLIVSLWCVVHFRNRIVGFLVVLTAYATMQFASLLSQGRIFDQYWITSLFKLDSAGGVAFTVGSWVIAGVVAPLLLGGALVARLREYDPVDPFQPGVLSRVARLCGADFSAYHLRMMGLMSQKILILFALLGMGLLIPLVSRPDAQLRTVVTIYIGAFVPLVLSLNHFSIIQVDRESGMLHNMFLRKTPYVRVVLNRAIILQLPVLFVQTLLLVIMHFTVEPVGLPFVLFVFGLSCMYGAVNLFMAILTMKSSVANLVLLFGVYVFLRDDVQGLIKRYPSLDAANPFSPLLVNGTLTVGWMQWCVVLGVLAVFIAGTVVVLGRLRYAEMSSS